jgi:hypothetical protein
MDFKESYEEKKNAPRLTVSDNGTIIRTKDGLKMDWVLTLADLTPASIGHWHRHFAGKTWVTKEFLTQLIDIAPA